MKKTIKNALKKSNGFICFALINLFLFHGSNVSAQDGNDTASAIEKITPSLRFSVTKNNDGTRTLTGVFAYRDKETKSFLRVKDIPITFSTGVDSVKNLGSFKTDENGKAICVIPSDFIYERASEDAKIHFAAEFAGDDKFEPASGEVDLIDVDVKLFLEVLDSVRTVRVQASKILTDGKSEPLNEETMPVCVGRMFSHLKIGEITFTEGEGTFEFPADIPGDTLGLLMVIAKFDDNENYGTVIKSEQIDWGVKTFHHNVYHPRSLWTAVAPVWMIVTLSIMLLGVWGHYIYTVIELVRLKRISKKEVEEKEA